MRLIDADELRAELSGMSYAINTDRHGLVMGYTHLDALSIIDAQPTAYDVDNVVEELGDLRDTTINTEYAPCETYGTECVDKAISIVKGAVKDE